MSDREQAAPVRVKPNAMGVKKKGAEKIRQVPENTSHVGEERRAASWRLPTSTGCTLNAVSSASRRWGAAMPGSIPARTNPCSTPASSFIPSSVARD
mgnify:CR=1 FL=1